MLHLLTPSRTDWLPVALADLDTLILDHGHCELKAMASARSFAKRYPENAEFVADMEELAVEEEGHYDDVRVLLDERGVAWRPAPKDAYVVRLLKEVRPPTEHRKLDRLLIAAIIEARSCERLGLLSEALEDDGLRKFYRRLFESEARHHGLFLEWARHFAGREAADDRLLELVRVETAYVLQKEPEALVHG